MMTKLEHKLDEKIELIDKLREKGTKIAKKHMKEVDSWKHTLNGHDGIYTSKHYIHGKRLLKCW